MQAAQVVRRLVALGAGAALIGCIVSGLGDAAGKPRGAHASATNEARKAPRYRHMIDSGSSARLVASYGWNLLDVSSRSAADRLPPKTRGLVWFGDYHNSSCTWEVSDAELRRDVREMARDPKVFGYFISDEPDPTACPGAPAQHRARTRLIHALSPGKPTVLLVDSNSGRATLKQIPEWAGTADLFALDPYPCYRGKPCNFDWIDKVIRAADKAGLSYWGVAQAFADSTWRWPTKAEERHMVSQWAASRQSGYMTFAWRWSGHTLAKQPALLGVLKKFNRTAPGARTLRQLQARTHRTRGASAGPATELHYAYAGPTSVTFDWKGTARSLRYGPTTRYGSVVRARPPSIAPFSSKGSFWQATISGLRPGKRYRYSIGPVRSTFSTPPVRRFRFDVEADVGASSDFDTVGTTQKQIAADKPAFVIVAGDLTYGNDNGQQAVGRHFNDVMAWSRRAAYMAAWGNHEWDDSTDDLRNYKGRLRIPHAQASPDAPRKGCCGADWGWFDAGGVRFISYPEPYTDAAWINWHGKAARVMAAAQRNPRIHFVVTFGHRPAYSTGYHPGDKLLASIMNALGDRYSKYVLNLNGHSHNYERFEPIHRVVQITAGGGGADLEPWSRGPDSRTAFRALHLEHLRVDVNANGMRIQAVCGPRTSEQGFDCRLGAVIDSYTIRTPRGTAQVRRG
jgi:calcineurin-like phosphoesterase family protein